jgi:hypothetical protein
MANKAFEIQNSSLRIGGVELQAGTTGVVIPGVTQATSYKVDEVDDNGDQSVTFPAPPIVIDYTTYFDYDNNGTSTGRAEYIVEELDDDGYIDDIEVTDRGSYTIQESNANDGNDLFAYTGIESNPFTTFVSSDWTQIPFRPKMRANEVENIGGGADLGDFNIDNNIIDVEAGTDIYIETNEEDGSGESRLVLKPNDDVGGSNPTRLEGSYGVGIWSNTTEPNSEKKWLFGNNGDLKLPPGGDIVDSTGASVLGGGGGASGFTKVSVLGQDDVFASEAGNELALVAGEGITITTDDANGTITISASGGGLEAPYKGFRAHYGTMYNNTDDENGPINKLVIYKDTVSPTSAIDTDTSSDDFQVTGLTGSDVVAMLVVFSDGTDWETQTPTATLKTFVEKIIDEVILDGGVEGDINTAELMKTAFYDNFNNFNTIIPNPKTDLQFFSFNNQFSISPQYNTVDGASFSGISYNMNNDTLDLGSWGQGEPNTHEVNDVHVIPGNTIQDANGNFLQTPDNDVTVTITGVAAGAILSYTVTGTLPRPSVNWPSNYIDDGGDDEYDGGNAIHTNLATDISYNSGNVVTGASAFGGGDYVVTYQAGIFGVFASGADINIIGTSGNEGGYGNDDSSSGFDSDGIAVTGSLYGESNEVSLGDFVFTNSTLTATDNDGDLFIKASDDLWLDALEDDIHIRANDDVRIKVGYDFVSDTAQREWRFDADGSIYFPDGSSQSAAWTGSVDYSNINNTPSIPSSLTDLISSGGSNAGQFLRYDGGTGQIAFASDFRVVPFADVAYPNGTLGQDNAGDVAFSADAMYYCVNAPNSYSLTWVDPVGWASGIIELSNRGPNNEVLALGSTLTDGNQVVTVTELITGGWDGTRQVVRLSTEISQWRSGTGTLTVLTSGTTANTTIWVKFSKSYNDLTDKPTLFSGDYDDLTNKPTLFDGDYNSLTNKPTIRIAVPTGSGPGGNLQADSLALAGLNPTENIPSTYGGDLILQGGVGGANGDLYGEVRIKSGTIGSNYEWHFTADKKIKLPAGGDIVNSTGTSVLFSGSYADLTNKPTIPTDVSDLTDTTSLLSSGGKIGYASGSTVTQTSNRGNGVAINALSGTIVTVNAGMVAGEISAFPVTNNQVDANSDIVLVQVVSPNLGNYNVIANPNSGIGGFYLTLQNISGFPISAEAVTIRFIVIKAPSA